MRIIPLFDTCCCMFSLKTGTILIGLTQAIVMLLRMIYHVNYPEKMKKSQVYTTCAVYTVIGILDFLLIFGAKNKYWLPVKLWIVFNTVIFVARAYLTCVELNRGPPYPKLDIIEHVCKLYGLLVVNSYYQEFVKESTSGPREECKCHLQPDISILYVQDPTSVAQKHNQWTGPLVAPNVPPLDRL